MKIDPKRLIPCLSPRERRRHATELGFWLAFAAMVFIRCSGGTVWTLWGVAIRLNSLRNPFLFLAVFFFFHLMLAREESFALGRRLIRGVQILLEQIHRPLGRVHWALKLAILAILLGLALLELPRRAAPPVPRLMVSPQSRAEVLRWRGEDRKIDFYPPALRRPLYQADRIEVFWEGYFFAPEEGVYGFALEAEGFHSLKIDGKKVLEAAPDWLLVRTECSLPLTYGSHAFELAYGDIALQSTVRFLWQRPGGKWEPVPEFFLSGTRLDADTQRALERRYLFQRVFFFAAVFFAWHFLTSGLERWQGLRRPRQRRAARWIAGIAVLAAFALRLQFLIRSEAMTHADEGLVALMARHIAFGKGYPAIYYDQVYNGTFLAWALAPFYRLFDAPLWNLKLATCLLSVAMVYLVYRLGRRWFGYETGLVAALLAAIAPVMAVVYGLMALVGPIEGIVVSLIGLWVATPILFENRCTARRSFALGLITGLGVWLNFQSFYYLLPLGLFWLLQGRRAWKRLPPLALGGLIGMAPLLGYNLTHGFATFRRFVGPRALDKDDWNIFETHLAGTGLPHILGSRVRWDMFRSFTPEPLPVIVGILFALALLALAIEALRRLVRASGGERFSGSPSAFLTTFFLGVVFLYLRSDFGEYYPRYLFSAFPMICLLLGWWIARVWRSSPPLGALLLTPFLLQNILGNWRVDPFYFSQPVHYVERATLLPQRSDALIAWLKQEGLTRLHCDYWIGYALALESSEEIVSECDRDRYPPYRDAVLESSRPAFLFHNHDASIDLYRYIFGTQLGYRLKELLPYVVFYPEKEFVPRARWRASASQDSENALAAIDGDLSYFSRWETEIGSGEAWLRIDLGEAARIEQVLVFRGVSPTGDSRAQGLIHGAIQFSLDGREWQSGPEPQPGFFGHHDRFIFPPRKARYLKIYCRPNTYPSIWSVYDVFVQ